MNSRLLLAIPFVFGATIAAAACSSSSSSTIVNPDSGKTGNPDCVTLAACCAKLPAGASKTSCENVVTADGTQCTTVKASFCTTTTVPDSGKGDTGTTKEGGGGTQETSPGNDAPIGTGDTGTDGGGEGGADGGDGSTASACSPHALPSGLTPAASPPPALGSCTTATASDSSQCLLNGDMTTCQAGVLGSDGGLDSCGNCVLSSLFTSTGEAANVGAFIVTVAPSAPGSTMGTELPALFNEAGCIAIKDPSSAGVACANAIEASTACEFAACLQTCVVTSSTDTAGQDAIFGDGTASNPGCLADADTAICKTYADAANSACASVLTDASTSPATECAALVTAAQAATAASPAGMTAWIDLFCGPAAGDGGAVDSGAGEDAAKEASH